MNRSLVLGLIGLSVAVVLVLFLRRDATVDTAAPKGTSGSSSAPAAGNLAVEQRGPKSLELGRSASKPGTEAEKGKDSDSGSSESAKARANLEQHRKAQGAPAGSRPRRAGREGTAVGDDASANFQVKSQIDDPTSVGEGRDARTRGGGGGVTSRRAVVDDWAGVETLDDPASDREPDEGEILSLFEGDPVAAQNQATIAKEVKLDENSAQFTAESEYAIPMAGKLSGDAGSISFWVRPDGETSDIDNASLVQLRSANEWANRLQVWKDGGNVRMVFADGNGSETGTTYASDSWAPDEWRQVTVTWGDQLNALYVNGELAGTSQYEGGFKILPNTLLHVGSNYGDDPRSLTGAVSQFRVYNRPLSPDEVAAMPSQYPE